MLKKLLNLFGSVTMANAIEHSIVGLPSKNIKYPMVRIKPIKNEKLFNQFYGDLENATPMFQLVQYNKLFNIVSFGLIHNRNKFFINFDLNNFENLNTVYGIFKTKDLIIQRESGDGQIHLEFEPSINKMKQEWENLILPVIFREMVKPHFKNNDKLKGLSDLEIDALKVKLPKVYGELIDAFDKPWKAS